MNKGVPCMAVDGLPGQFSNEYAVHGKDARGVDFSLFCPEEYVEPVGGPPSPDRPVQGYLAVEILQSKGELVLVRPPER